MQKYLFLCFYVVYNFFRKKYVMNKLKKTLLILLTTALLSGCDGCGKKPEPVIQVTETPTVTTTAEPTAEPTEEPTKEPEVIDRDGIYDTKDEVALYIYTYHELPSNYMTKKEARKLGWKSGALNRVVKGKCIGGDVFMNSEGILPKGEDYIECDIDTIHEKKRGAERIVYSIDDWDVYYTADHYRTFEQLYGDE